MKLKNLQTKYLARKCEYFETIDSTQSEIYRRINSKIENGETVIANLQTNGNGTHGRKWYTDEGGSIAFSMYIEANCNIKKLDGITIEIAKIMLEIFKEKYNIELSIKEPNDIVYNSKKIGGILTESKMSGEIVKYLVVGIGINTNKTKFNKEIKNIATSIKNEFNIEVDNFDFIAGFCNKFEKYIIQDKILPNVVGARRSVPTNGKLKVKLILR